MASIGSTAMEERVAEYVGERVGLGELAGSSAGVIRTVLLSWVRFAGAPEWSTGQVVEWVDQPAAANSRKSRLTKLRPFCQWLVANDVIVRDPTLRVRRGPTVEMPPRCLHGDDVAAILSHCCDERCRVAVLLMAHCGLRIGETVAINGADLDRRARSVEVRGKGGRGGVTRVMPVPGHVWRRLAGLAHDRGPVFRSELTGGRLTADRLRRLVTAAMVDAGVKSCAGDGVSPHSLRHTFAQDLLDGGADVRLVQTGLGHRSLRSTELYLRREPPGLREAMEQRRYVS